MRAAQRGGSVNPTTDQQIEVLDGNTPDEAAYKLSKMIEHYAVRVVSMTGFTGMNGRCVLVAVLEEEPQH